MIIAVSLEVLMVMVTLASADIRTKIIGGVLWAVYFYYSATFAAIESFADWWNDRNNPPGGPA